MPVYIKKGNIRFKDAYDDAYTGVDVVAERSLEEILTDIEQTGAYHTSAVEYKGAETLASIPDNYTTLSNAVNRLDYSVYESQSQTNRIVKSLSFVSGGWWSQTEFHESNDYATAQVDVQPGQTYEIKAYSTDDVASYVILDSSDDVLLSGAVSGTSEQIEVNQSVLIPSGGAKLVFSALASDYTWRGHTQCVYLYTTTIKRDRINSSVGVDYIINEYEGE